MFTTLTLATTPIILTSKFVYINDWHNYSNHRHNTHTHTLMHKTSTFVCVCLSVCLSFFLARARDRDRDRMLCALIFPSRQSNQCTAFGISLHYIIHVFRRSRCLTNGSIAYPSLSSFLPSSSFPHPSASTLSPSTVLHSPHSARLGAAAALEVFELGVIRAPLVAAISRLRVHIEVGGIVRTAETGHEWGLQPPL